MKKNQQRKLFATNETSEQGKQDEGEKSKDATDKKRGEMYESELWLIYKRAGN